MTVTREELLNATATLTENANNSVRAIDGILANATPATLSDREQRHLVLVKTTIEAQDQMIRRLVESVLRSEDAIDEIKRKLNLPD